MDEKNKKIKKREEPDSMRIIPLEEATAQTVFDREFADLKEGLKDQQKLSWQIVVGVAIAFLFTIGLIGTEIMLFHTCANEDFLDLQNQYFQKVEEIKKENFQTELRLQNEINDLKIKLIQEPE
jgi:hypothetical protein